VTAGTGITGGGTSGAVTITNDMATTITASGDIVVGTGSGTYDNLPIGTTAQVLTADTTVSPYKVKWATPSSGGMTLISTTTLSGTSTTISSIPQTYKSLVAYVYGLNLSATDYPKIKPNNSGNVFYSGICLASIVASSADWFLSTGGKQLVTANTNNAWTFQIDNYASSTNFKPLEFYGYFVGPADNNGVNCAGAFQSNTAITSLVFTTNSGTNTYSAGTVLLYGVN
jgi:hypothetical protein